MARFSFLYLLVLLAVHATSVKLDARGDGDTAPHIDTVASKATKIVFDVFAHHGRNIIEKQHKRQKSRVPATPIRRALEEAQQGRAPKTNVKIHAKETGVTPVGILGAGMAGLYTALILDSLNITYEILEASDRAGGRVYTYPFPNGKKYDYFDVGAMRFPLPPAGEHGVMTRLSHLFSYPPLNTGDLQLASKLIPHYYSANQGSGIMHFNNVTSTVNADPQSDFKAQGMGVDQSYINAGVKRIVSDAIGPFATQLFNDINNGTTDGWENMQSFDQHSTRSYLSFKYVPSADLVQQYQIPATSLSTDTISWCETFEKSSGWYDKALTETVLNAVAFGNIPGVTVDWKCLDGGSRGLPNTIKEYIDQKTNGQGIKLNVPVTAIAPANPDDPTSPLVVTAGGAAHSYSHVISTIPLPVVRSIDTSQCDISVMQSTALRLMQYSPAVKIGMQFTEPWWSTGENQNGNPINIVGGQSFTDLPIRTIVYPSYGVNSTEPSTVLIASYSWTNDAERLGNLINTGSDQELEDLVLRNLATVHNVTYQYLKERLVAVYSWDWNHNPLTMGAYAFFGPGQYENLYDSLSGTAANGRLQFAGELLSVRHAWVVGALDSAWSSVNKLLFLIGASDDMFNKFYETWGINWEWTKSGAEAPHRNNTVTLKHEDNLLLEHLIVKHPELFAGHEAY